MDKLQLVGVTTFFLAAKYEEIYPPFISDLSYIAADTYTTSQIREMERKVLQTLDYQLNKPHVLTFLRRYSKLANITSTEHALAKYILEQSLLQHDMSAIPPSKRAAAALQLAIQLSSKQNASEWPELLASKSYDASQLTGTRLKLKGALRYGHEHPEFTTTKMKFKQSRFCRVSDLSVLKCLKH